MSFFEAIVVSGRASCWDEVLYALTDDDLIEMFGL